MSFLANCVRSFYFLFFSTTFGTCERNWRTRNFWAQCSLVRSQFNSIISKIFAGFCCLFCLHSFLNWRLTKNSRMLHDLLQEISKWPPPRNFSFQNALSFGSDTIYLFEFHNYFCFVCLFIVATGFTSCRFFCFNSIR